MTDPNPLTPVEPLITMSKDHYESLLKLSERRDICWHCGGRLIWHNDTDLGDVYPDLKGVFTELKCEDCGANVEYSIKVDE